MNAQMAATILKLIGAFEIVIEGLLMAICVGNMKNADASTRAELKCSPDIQSNEYYSLFK